MNRHTLELFKRYEPEEVVMWCPSCIYFYDEVQQVEMPFPVRHAAEFLAGQLPRLQFSRRVDSRVALHYHGVSEPRRREGLAGRRLLEAVPGLSFVEVEPDPRLGRMCTAAVQAQVGIDAWNGMVREQIERARAAGATTLATIYHGCQRLLCGFESESGVVIEHYLSVFARALDIEFEDKFKKYRLWQDPERVLADSTPCQVANGVDPERAQRLVRDTFGSVSTPAAQSTVPS